MAVLGAKDGWLQVRFDTGLVGWVAGELVKAAAAAREVVAEMQATAAPASKSIVSMAMTYVGTPYRRGGTSRKGVDCSGLVYAVCREIGVKLPRSARDMWGTGQKVDNGNLQPGDLVFFKNTYRDGISHVGIFIGDGNFVHAVKPGRGVQVSSLGEGYYAQHWAGAYRLMN
jgi:cell wall-associated NlpC family hydrolase